MAFQVVSKSRAFTFVTVVSAIACFLGTATAGAQSAIDPSSALLLNSGSGTTAKPRSAEPRLESGRYTVRPRAEKPVTRRQVVESAPSVETPTPTPAPVVLPATESGVVIVPESAPSAVEPSTKVEAKPSPAQTMATEGRVESRSHLLEVSIGTAYFYESSESSFSYRQSTMNGPAYVAGARVWLSPEFGIGGNYVSTLGGQVGDRPTPTTTSAVSASRTETAFGVYLKKSFGESNLTFGVEMVDSQFKVASDTVSKVKTKSGGIRVSLEGEFAKTPLSAWRMGFSVMPKLQHEEGAARTDVKSGSNVEAYAISAALERRWHLDDANALFIRAEHRLERDLFSGAATAPDPLNGTTPNGVAVTVGTTLIQFGYNWGN